MKTPMLVFMFLTSITSSLYARAEIIMGCNIGDYSSNYWYTSATMLLLNEPIILGATHIRAGNEMYGVAYHDSIWVNSLYLEEYSDEASITVTGTSPNEIMNAGPVTRLQWATKYLASDPLTWNQLEVTAEAWGKLSSVWTYDSSFDEPCAAYLSVE